MCIRDRVTVLGLVNKLPVIGTVNRGLGWLVGGATALLDKMCIRDSCCTMPPPATVS